ncbi:HMG box-containing protein [Neolecta irregularis DAH-3]|uniref:HMG box-containing protein n=1 Tax=Neolecta irregularis (strain DAH-3) TaxID=1198029 RepID=A0A1U7LJK9_NEOID|nr:HMG box-containing protein [Neolecta irregularis DAH-3]|eukprot:OLL22829.1 HMG box-containing protein [Neolecta irregularis DAH-3]
MPRQRSPLKYQTGLHDSDSESDDLPALNELFAQLRTAKENYSLSNNDPNATNSEHCIYNRQNAISQHSSAKHTDVTFKQPLNNFNVPLLPIRLSEDSVSSQRERLEKSASLSSRTNEFVNDKDGILAKRYNISATEDSHKADTSSNYPNIKKVKNKFPKTSNPQSKYKDSVYGSLNSSAPSMSASVGSGISLHFKDYVSDDGKENLSFGPNETVKNNVQPNCKLNLESKTKPKPRGKVPAKKAVYCARSPSISDLSDDEKPNSSSYATSDEKTLGNGSVGRKTPPRTTSVILISSPIYEDEVEAPAYLDYSPPISPTRTKVLNRPTTPRRIPLSPHKAHEQNFWDEQHQHGWIAQHTPSPRKTSPIKKPQELKSRRDFTKTRESMATVFLADLDQKITNCELSRKCRANGGIKIVWSNRLQTTAGRAKWKKEKVKMGNLTTEENHLATIELSTKVIDSEEKLQSTLAHEFCHLTTWILSGVTKRPHGKEFKSWGNKVMKVFPKVPVTTTHQYEIYYKFRWTCSNPLCAREYGRQSKSIDPEKHICSICQGRLKQTYPEDVRLPNAYQTFIKENYAKVKSQNDGSPHKEIMSTLVKEYNAQKDEGQKRTIGKPNKHEASGLEDIFGAITLD